MKIAFIHPHKAFLPEIDAYQTFFSDYNIETIVARPEEINNVEAEVEWHFMGTDKAGRKKNVIKIHEYTSASVPPFRALKNFSKKIVNINPDYRLFLNKYVQRKMRFNDAIPYGFLDMGIANSFFNFNSSRIEKEFDFVYAGSVSPERKIDKLIERFATKNLQEHSLLILSRDYDRIQCKFQYVANIHFMGPVPHAEMPAYLSKAKFAINFMPDEEPFNQQTSTKLLEYAGLKIPIITTDYKWVKDFQKVTGGKFFYLKKDLSNFDWKNISSFEYSFPDLRDWTWENQIRKSGVLGFLKL